MLALECDVTERAAVEQAVQTIREIWGTVDVLINNAGVVQVGPQQEMTLDDYQQAMPNVPPTRSCAPAATAAPKSSCHCPPDSAAWFTARRNNQTTSE